MNIWADEFNKLRELQAENKDCCKKCGSYAHTTKECTVKEEITLTRGDYGSRNVPGSAWHTAAKRGFKGYKAGGGLTPQFKLADDVQIDHIDGSKTEIVDVVKAPAMVAAPKLSNWKEEMQWQDEALKPEKLKIKEGGVKNKVEINPEVKTEGYGATKRKEVKKALKRDRPSLSAKQRKKIASKVVKSKGDTSKSDDRYAYEETVAEGGISFTVGGGGGSSARRQMKINKAADRGVANAASKATGPLLPNIKLANSYEPEVKTELEEKKNLSNVSPLIDRVRSWSKTMKKEEAVKFLKTGNVKDMSRGRGENIIHGKTGVDYRLMVQNKDSKKTVAASHEVEGEVITEGPSDKSDARTKRDWKGPGAPGLDAHRERIRKHKERRGKKKVKEEVIDERLGGKGYKPRKDYAGRRVSGDWEDSDRGAGNKATRRSGGSVKAKSPTYLAHVKNKKKKTTSEGMGVGLAAGALAAWTAWQGMKAARKIKKDAGQGTKGTTGGNIRNRNLQLQKALQQMSYEPEGNPIDELNRYGKETGKATGSLNKRPGSKVKKGGDEPGALRNVRGMIRKETGKPEGQQKKKKGDKDRRQVGDRRESPKSTVTKRREAKARADAAMRDTRGT